MVKITLSQNLKIFCHVKLKLRARKPQICHFSIQGHDCVIFLTIKLLQKVISLRPLWINGDYCIPLIDWLVFKANFGNISAILWHEQILWIYFLSYKILRNKTYLCMLLFIAFCNCSWLWYFFSFYYLYTMMTCWCLLGEMILFS